MKLRTVLCVVLFLISTGLAAAQSTTSGTLSGTVTDPTDAIVPGAKVTATNTATSTVLEAISDDRGVYRIPLMPPGVYNLKVEKPGFAAASRNGIAITVGEAAVMDVKLAVSGSTEIVQVQTEAPAIETERTQQSNTINEQSVRNLPINRRDYLSFSLLAPGIADSKAMPDSNSFPVKQTPHSGPP